MADITILGSGGFGLALAVLCNTNGHKVTVWSKFQDEIDAIKRTGELKAKLPGVFIPEEIEFSTDISCVKDADMVLIGIPSKFVREVCLEAQPFMKKDIIVVNTSKGLEEGSLKRMSEVVGECFPENKIVVLTGPSHAEEVGRGIPTAVVAACEDRDTALYVQKVFSSKTFRIYINDDVIGSEIGGSLKNVIALACGVVDGMGCGDNTKAALMTRGIREIAALGMALGADNETFGGLSGIGDLIVTCTSMHSRNRRAGILIGQGTDPESAVRKVGTVEGYFCTKTAYELCKKMNIEMPITEALWNVLFNGLSPVEAITELMSRPSKAETEMDFLEFT
ncbi:MAG: NAD(P)-dependent glycerol-3-phosphate dehydrogenase [Oscillospiraceae bacterium]|nr:NAD(P)-dependent glycerol-3-phosphate dehydrogenase [Oscillospiraceae bacterium]MBQ8883529.1 NAD(P)-dependent glycerol-3-phosphate dehydrogenase [Oscillospiraceae bacterium]